MNSKKTGLITAALTAIIKKSRTPREINTTQECARCRIFFKTHSTTIGGAKLWEQRG